MKETSGPKLYCAYNLTIASEIDLPELIAMSESEADGIDVRVRLAPAPASAVREPQTADSGLRVSADALWLDVADVGQFLVRNGSDIAIEPHNGAKEDVIRLFLLGSAFGALLFQRQFLVLHGNAVRIGEQCLVCVGPSGIGKSTLAASFLQRGFDILSDDVVPVDTSGAAVPGFPRLKLWEDAAEKLKIATGGLSRVGFNLNKFNLPTPAWERTRNLPIRWIYVLQASDATDRVEIEHLTGVSRIIPLIEHTYRPHFMKGMSLEQQHLQRCARLADQAHVSLVSRPKSAFMIDELVEKLLADSAENP